jgi:hypothetical protein
MQRIADHTHEDIDCFSRTNQSFDGVGCVFKDNTSGFDQTVESLVVRATQRRGDPNQVASPADVVTFHLLSFATYHARASHSFGGYSFRSLGGNCSHEPPPT